MMLKLIFWCWDIFALFWLMAMFSSKRTLQRQTTGSRARYWLPFLLSFWLLFGFHFHHHGSLLALVIFPHSGLTGFLGFLLTALGLALAIWARITLGTNWSGSVTFKENHELVLTGPYAHVRHPIYTAILLMFLGTALAIGTVAGLIGLPILYLSFWIKYRQEEALMIEHFGDRYREYMKRVGAIIPASFTNPESDRP